MQDALNSRHRADNWDQILLASGELPQWCAALPALNAALNGVAGLLLVIGYILIRSGRAVAHRRTMVLAFMVSTVFLACYLTYHHFLYEYTGSHGKAFTGKGAIRWLYFFILASHVVLAVAVPVLACLTILRGYQQQLDKHRRLARVTFPIWLYVSVTGVVVYLFLYHFPA